MNTLTIFPMIVLSLLIGSGAKQYEHSYHTGLIGLMRIPDDLPHGGSAHLQLDFTVNPMSDSIFGRFQAIDVRTAWKQMPPAGTFRGKITRLNGATRSFGGHYTTSGVQGDGGSTGKQSVILIISASRFGYQKWSQINSDMIISVDLWEMEGYSFSI